jgi:hypothetical protein
MRVLCHHVLVICLGANESIWKPLHCRKAAGLLPGYRACSIYSVPCKSHDRETGCELSWDYRGICSSQRK